MSMRRDLVGRARGVISALIIGLFCAFASPAASQSDPAETPAVTEQAEPAATPFGAEAFAADDYILGVADRLRVIVYGEVALSGDFVIDSSGRVSLPLIGEIEAGGTSVREFERRVETALSQGYLNDPRVNAEVLNFRPFYILGEVTRPGQYPYTNNLTVLNAVATAGGFTPLANQMRVYVKRAGEEVETELSLSGSTPVQPGDTIRIAKGAFYILGEVARPGEYAFTDGLTAMNAVATAGGFTYRANRGRVFIQRQGAPDERSYRLRPDLRIQPGDTIRIGERFF
jgi:protein involved in polysaccharide export with SLBB domain